MFIKSEKNLKKIYFPLIFVNTKTTLMIKLATLFISLAVVSSSALAAIPSPGELAKALAGADKAVKVNVSPKSIEDEPGRNGWLPTVVTVETNSSFSATPEWTQASTITYTYDDQGRVVESVQASTGVYFQTTTTRYTYTEYGQVATQQIENTGVFAYSFGLKYTYDSICHNVVTKMEMRYSPSEPYSTIYEIKITRDDRGRVVSVMPMFKDQDDDNDITIGIGPLEFDFDAMVITYGEDGFPSSIVTGDLEWRGTTPMMTEQVVFSNLKFDHCDGQITNIANIFVGDNRASSGTMTEEGEISTFTTSYDGTTYNLTVVEPDDVEELVIETLDEYGSNVATSTETDRLTQRSASEININRYERFGIMTENKETEISQNGVETIDEWTKAEVTYDPSTGFPTMTVGSEWNSLKQTFEPTERHIYGAVAGIEDVAIDTPSGAAKPLRQGTFTLDGRSIPSGATLAPGLYIINGRKTLVR